MEDKYYDCNYFCYDEGARKIKVLGDQDFIPVLADTIFRVPKCILDDVLVNCSFLMLNKNTEPSSAAAFVPKKLIEGKSILAFYEMLYLVDEDEKVNMILHEIAHYVLGHRDSESDTDEEYLACEKEADSLKNKWIDDWDKYYKKMDEDTKKAWIKENA